MPSELAFSPLPPSLLPPSPSPCPLPLPPAAQLAQFAPSNKFEERLSADIVPASELAVSFDSIGALQGVKESLRELVMLPLRRPELFARGALTRPCRGILLFGPPGTGKTMLAKAVATEAGANFINVSTSFVMNKVRGVGGVGEGGRR